MLIGQTSTNDPVYRRTVGPGKLTLWTLANSRIGASARYQVSFRFRAESTGRVTGVRMYFQEGAPGYHGGNGGVIRVQIVEDDGNGRPNPNQVLGTGHYSPSSNPRGSRSIFPQIAVQSTANINEGTVYHVLQTNVSSDPGTNYISSNNCQVWKGYGHPLRFTDPQDWATLFKVGSGPWQDFGVNGDAQKYWAPILQVYCTGGNFGLTTMEGGAVAHRDNGGVLTNLYTRDPFRELFTPRRNWTVHGFSVQYASAQNDHYLDWSLGKEGGTIHTPYSEYQEVKVNTLGIANTVWRDVYLDNPVTLEAGKPVALEFRPRGITRVSTCRTGNSYGFSAWTESIGQILLNGRWQNWNHNRHTAVGSDSSFPVVLHLS